MYNTFSNKINDSLDEPMFLGNNVTVARFDHQRYPIFDKLTEKQLSFFWRPEEVDITQDKSDYSNLTDAEKHIFLSNLKYQTLLDSVQGRSPSVAFLPIVSLPELETWIQTWAFSETIHSRSYTHIIRGIYDDPTKILDAIATNPEICRRAVSVTKYYDDLIHICNYVNGVNVDLSEDNELRLKLKKRLYLTLISVNVLEAIRFYISFACSFSFAERGLMEGNAKIIKLIARDESLHLSGTQTMLNILRFGADDPEMHEIANELEDEVIGIFKDAVEQEKDWVDYLFKDGSMIGLNSEILKDYIEYITNVRLKAISLPEIYNCKTNPLPWMNSWLTSDNVQVAPQEVEISSYLVGNVDGNVTSEDLSEIIL